MSSEKPTPETTPQEPPAPEPPADVPSPPEPEPAAAPEAPADEGAQVTEPPPFEAEEKEEEWIEEYERETEQKRPQKQRSYGGVILATIIVVFIIVWTLMSPPILSQVGTAYVNSDQYANLGGGIGSRDIYWLGTAIHVGNTTWGVSIGGEQNVSAGQAAEFTVLVTKVSERTGNWWFRGTSIVLKSADLYITGGDLVGSMVNKTKLSFGQLGTLSATFDDPGTYDCTVLLRFEVYEMMRIGFIPLENVDFEVELDVPIIAS